MQFASRRFLVTCVLSLIPVFATLSFAQVVSGTVAASGTAARDQEPVVQLDTLVVTAATELPRPENWLTASIPGFEIYSSASERASRKLIQDFEMFRVALDAAWPINVTVRKPTTLVLCGRSGFDDFIPRSDQADYSKDSARASTTLIGPEQAFIVIDMSTSSVTLNDTTYDIDASSLGATFDVDYYSLLYREYVHYLLSQTETPPPAWYEEGVLQIIQKMEVYPKYIRIGELRSVRRGQGKNNMAVVAPVAGDGEDMEVSDEEDVGIPGMETIPDEDFNVALDRRALLGFKDFFGVTRDSPLARNPIGNNVWAKQCYAFVHRCLYGIPNKNYKTALETLVARSVKEPMTEELFKECFGVTYKRFLVELRGYIGLTAYQYTDFVVKGKGERIDAPAREFTLAPEGDSARMKADALVLANNASPSIPTLRGAYGRGARDPEFLASYGLAAHAAGQTELARRMLSKAVVGKAKRAAAYPAYARILLDDAKAHPEASDGVHITPTQLTPILEVLFAARKLRPALPQTYRTIADAWIASSATPSNENFVVLSEGLVLFRNDRALLYQSARILLRMKNNTAARALVEFALKTSKDDAERERFNELKLQLPTPPPPADAAQDSSANPDDEAQQVSQPSAYEVKRTKVGTPPQQQQQPPQQQQQPPPQQQQQPQQ
ncbi:hypothetical protein M2447_000869 [Ereboglobus sp. PH5-10]|uniref:hypothetical protein n=1 Tax=Ereboglobus sp. PH5-10 TaxID=2940629 RepID=UPI00240563A9|nr:hypothetical protein [Ereboglobus sp. PH5-10]MDF9826787.1 hypothetical protein [Ereboglobus sp. PH5-10]